MQGVRAATRSVGQLSGGNQQKVVLGKWLARQPRVLIFDEPTRGVDVGARSEIYALMDELAAAGVAVLMISSDLEEVLGMSDRVLVLHEGRLAGELPRAALSEEAVMHLATGGRADQQECLMQTMTPSDVADRPAPLVLEDRLPAQVVRLLGVSVMRAGAVRRS